MPVVYLHGGPGQGSHSFAALAGPALERSHRMVYLDQRGSGRSERPWNDAYSVELMVEDLEQLRRAWGVPKIAIIGHSFGTLLGMEYAAKYPGRVAALVLAASVPDIRAAFEVQCDRLERTDPEHYRRATEGMAPGAYPRCNPLKGLGQERSERWINAQMFPDPAIQELVRHWDKKDGLGNTGIVGRKIINADLLKYRFDKRDRLSMPVLIVAGERDYQAAVEPQTELAKNLRDGRIIVYPGSGHFMWAEQPDRFARDVTAFLAKAPN
jgi:proline iminopeptidase